MTAMVGTITGLYLGPSGQTASEPADELHFTYDGAIGDRHSGRNKRAGVRERQLYAKGTMIQNKRQISLVSNAELAAIAAALDTPVIRPQWLGANIALAGLPDFSQTPGLSRLQFEGGLVLVVYGQNTPCTAAGSEVERHAPGVAAHRFPKAAMKLRGLVAWVEYPGHLPIIRVGESVTLLLPTATV